MHIRKICYSKKIGLPNYSSQGLRLTAEVGNSESVEDVFQNLQCTVNKLLGGTTAQSDHTSTEITNNLNSCKSGFNQGQENSQSQTLERITQKQLQYLFKLLARKNINGEAAEIYLKKEFGVNSTSQITMKQASDQIEHLLSDSI